MVSVLLLVRLAVLKASMWREILSSVFVLVMAFPIFSVLALNFWAYHTMIKTHKATPLERLRRSFDLFAVFCLPSFSGLAPFRVSLRAGSNSRRLSFKDTTEAWDLLRNSFRHQERRGSRSVIERTQCHRTLMDLPIHEMEDCTIEEDESLPDFTDYEYVLQMETKLCCSFCESHNSLRHPLHPCRICSKVYHDACLKEKGHGLDEFSLEALEESGTDLGWSCPSCEELMNLLTEDECQEIIEVFDSVSGNGNWITQEQFLKSRKETYESIVGLSMPRYRENQEEELFRSMDRNKTGTIEWWEYVPPMCLRILSRRTPEELLSLVTPLEVDKVRKIFSAHDLNRTGTVDLPVAQTIYKQWYLSLLKMNEQERKFRSWACEPHNSTNDLEGIIPIKMKTSQISWIQYLKLSCLHIIAARANTVRQVPYAPASNGAFDALMLGNGRDSCDEDDEL